MYNPIEKINGIVHINGISVDKIAGLYYKNKYNYDDICKIFPTLSWKDVDIALEYYIENYQLFGQK